MNVGRDAFGFLRGLRDLLFEIRFQQKDTKAAKKDKTRCVEQRGLGPRRAPTASGSRFEIEDIP